MKLIVRIALLFVAFCSPAWAQKIVDLPALGAAPATNDLLIIRDTSATSTKSLTITNLFTDPTFVSTIGLSALGGADLATMTHSANEFSTSYGWKAPGGMVSDRGVNISSTSYIGFTDQTSIGARNDGTDAQFWRISTGVVGFGTSRSGPDYAGSALVISPQSVSQLPTCDSAKTGARAFVTDASTTLILGLGTTVTGGGANKVPVYCDATNWKYGG